MKITIMLCTLLLCTLLRAQLAEPQVYQPIIDAKPFGEIGEFKKVTPEQLLEEQKQKEAIAQKFTMCGITDKPDGTRAIAFVDATNNTPLSYLLAEGESQNGFTLVKADYNREYATLTKDGLTFTLGLGKGLIEDPLVEETPTSDEPAIDHVQVNSQQIKRNRLTASLPKPKKGSYRDRLQQREAAKQEKERQKLEAANQELEAKAEKLKAQERRLQIERIKRGLEPTTPIQLTPEEDRELAEAGVFDVPDENDSTAENDATDTLEP